MFVLGSVKKTTLYDYADDDYNNCYSDNNYDDAYYDDNDFDDYDDVVDHPTQLICIWIFICCYVNIQRKKT